MLIAFCAEPMLRRGDDVSVGSSSPVPVGVAGRVTPRFQTRAMTAAQTVGPCQKRAPFAAATQGLSRLAAFRGHPQGLALFGPSTAACLVGVG